jgi:superfamily II DNA or RNA helicase
MTFTPYPHQTDIINETRLKLKTKRAVVIRSACRSGKTVMAALMQSTAAARGFSSWFMCDRDFLVEQTSRTFNDCGLGFSYIASGRAYNPYRSVQICSVQTLAKRIDRYQPPKLLIVDETHHIVSGSWFKIFKAMAPETKIIGLTATLGRLDGRGLDEVYEDVILGPSEAWLIESGFLSSYKAYAPSQPDLGNVHMRAGDYAVDELADVMDRGALIGDMVRHYKELAYGRRAMCFAASVNHSQHIVAQFCDAGIPFIHLDGNCSTAERMKAAHQLADGEIMGISNVNLFSEGADLASLIGRPIRIDCAILARPTQSFTLHHQQVCRALTPGDSPAILIDHAGNFLRHGLPDDEREHTLEGRKKGDKKSDGLSVTVRRCEGCYTVYRASEPRCPQCGKEHEIKIRKIELVEGSLKEVDRAKLRAERELAKKQDQRQRQREEWGSRSINELVEVGRARGYDYPEQWARTKWSIMEKMRQARSRGQEQTRMW